jgi:methyl coenzyme M reductase gamma subunit
MMASSSLSEGAPVMAGRILLTGPQLAAAATALTRFRTEETKSNLARFIIEVRETEEFFEVMFGPEHVDVFDPITGEKMIVRGGGNVHGRAVRYFVSKDSGEIVKKQFSR